MADAYINELEINGQKRLDLTQDTATPETVLEGETFHQKSGAPAVGKYRPSNEIEARLRATVGHSSKNLLKITADSQTINGVTFTIDKLAGTITANGTAIGNADLIFSHVNILANIQYVMSGSIESPSSAADRIAATYIDQYANLGIDYGSGFELSSTTGIPNAAIKIRIFGGKTVTNAVFKPMLREASISDDNFEPYVTPTDERIVDLEARIAALEAIINNR